jgi:FAD/FMN-containing dehydrogenase
MDSKKVTGIARVVNCQVLSDKQSLNLYSVDASSYIVKPLVVVIPENEQDIISVLKYASKNKIPVTARGAGTGLVGSALGKGIILDLKNFDKIRIERNHVEVGAGVYKGKLDSELEKKDRFFAPNPSIGPYCTIGGMVATNASGSHSLKYGSTIDNLLAVTIITANGNVIRLPSDSKFSRTIFGIIKSDLQKKFPRVSKNSCGYRLDAIKTISDMHKIMAASEGTLGIITSVKLKTLPIPAKRMLVILSYKTIKQAASDSSKIVKLKPSALEMVDKNITKHIKSRLTKNSSCLLFIEFDDDLNKCRKNLRDIISNARIVKTSYIDSEIRKWWDFRNSALSYSLRSIMTKESMPTIMEDATVPVGKLSILVDIIEKISRKYKMKFVLYGHAGNGNLHIRPILKDKNKKRIKNIAKEFFSQVISTGGSITGEHGDGLARSEFVKLQYGKEAYYIFKKIKNKFDPKNILNPDKIITSKQSMTKNLKI